MPAKSEKQRKLMGAALACKRKKGPCKGGAAKVAKSMSAKELKKFSKKKKQNGKKKKTLF